MLIDVDCQSFGAYGATKLAILEHARLRAVVAQSPPVDATFAHDFVIHKTLGNREYLFGLAPALMSIFEGSKSPEDLAAALGKLSLVEQGLLGSPAGAGMPTAPMLVITCALATQVTTSNASLLLSAADGPHEACINPWGCHLARQ